MIFLIHSHGITPSFTCISSSVKQAAAIRLSQFKIPARTLFGVPWLLGTFHASQVVYHRSAVWLPIKNETWVLNYRPALLAIMAVLVCHSPLSLSQSLFVPQPSLPPHPPTTTHSTGLFIFLSISLTHTLLSVSLHPSWLTAIRHWPCSLCLLPLPQVQPSHNYFLWFTVVGHCHPPKVFTAEITHTVFSYQTYLHCSIMVHSVQRLWLDSNNFYVTDNVKSK